MTGQDDRPDVEATDVRATDVRATDVRATDVEAVDPEPAAGRRRPEPGDGLAALTGSGSSVVGVEGALRARDVSRPTAADLAAAATLPVRRATARPGED
jgi:hypothetical protein